MRNVSMRNLPIFQCAMYQCEMCNLLMRIWGFCLVFEVCSDHLFIFSPFKNVIQANCELSCRSAAGARDIFTGHDLG